MTPTWNRTIQSIEGTISRSTLELLERLVRVSDLALGAHLLRDAYRSCGFFGNLTDAIFVDI